MSLSDLSPRRWAHTHRWRRTLVRGALVLTAGLVPLAASASALADADLAPTGLDLNLV